MQLHLDSWDGPLAVLLHLIKTQSINIFNIPVVAITTQYLQFLDQTPTLDFDRAGSYLSMAAELVEIKARFLVPAMQNKINAEAQSLEEMSNDDPRKELVEKLLEFEAIREACAELDARPILGRDTFGSGEFKRREKEFNEFPAPIKGDVMDLVIALEQVLLRFASERAAPTVKVHAQKISIHDRMHSLKARFFEHEECYLTDLVDESKDRQEFVVTLMASLELAKLGHLMLEQTELFGPIQYSKGPRFEDSLRIDKEGRALSAAA